MNQTLFCRLNEMKQKQNNQQYEHILYWILIKFGRWFP